MNDIRVLLAGETWITVARHYKGWDHFTSTTFHDGAEQFKHILAQAGMKVTHMPGHEVPNRFPRTAEELSNYDVVILSDIGANSLLLAPETWLAGQATCDRLSLLREYVQTGGGLVMVGGYYSFQGIYGRAAYHDTAVEAVLPVSILPHDDRRERPEGITPTQGSGFEELAGLPTALKLLLGYNKTVLRKDAVCVYEFRGDPILALREVGQGRTAIWASDIGPHWCPEEFLRWEGNRTLWVRVLQWVSQKE